MDGKQLKNSILQWAIQGKLVPQNPKDEPAQKLLERIASARHSERSEESSKRSKKTSKNPTSRIYRENGIWYEQVGNAEPKDISEDIPFEKPENWAWCRLGSLIKISSGDGLVAKDMKKGEIPVFGGNGITGYHTEANVFEETVVIGRVGFYCGSVHVTPAKAWITDNAFITEYPQKYIDRGFLVYCLKFLDLGKSHNATAQPVVSGKKIYPLLFPLPPLAEQKRIVAKLEQVLPLVDEYNVAQEQLDKLNKELPEALKKSILQQAIQGKLVPQNSKDEPAQKLLERIASCRHSEQSEESSKRSKKISKNPTSHIYCENGTWYEQIGNAAPKDISDEIPFDIPTSWVWCRVENISQSYIGLTYKPQDVASEGTVVLRSSNIKNGQIVLDDIVRVKMELSEKYYVQENDILICARNGSKKLVGKAALIPKFDEKMTFGAFMAICKTPFYAYVYYYLMSDLFYSQLWNVSGTTTINQLTQNNFNRFLVPLPPLAEQKRIVAKLEQLFKVL